MNDARKKVVLALDVDTESEALKLVEKLKDHVGMFKIGSQLFTHYGPSIVKAVLDKGGQVFLDLKFHDIPHTVAMAAREAVRMGVSIFNVHVVGGSEMMRETMTSVEKSISDFQKPRPIVLGVTVLTSLNDQVFLSELNYKQNIAAQVEHFALLAKQNGLGGVVASPHEIGMIRKAVGPGFVILTPGIRPEWSQKNDQKRFMTPREALVAGADYMVIGRPIIAAQDPVSAAQRVVEELS